MSENLRGISEVRVKRVDILERVKANLEQHQTDHKTAYEKWRSNLGEAIDAVTSEMSVNFQHTDQGKLEKAISDQYSVWLEKPQDQTTYYENLIDQLEMSQDEFLVLSAQEFRRIWRNEVNNDYLVSNSKYTTLVP